MWREFGFDAALHEAHECGSLLAGISAGANCRCSCGADGEGAGDEQGGDEQGGDGTADAFVADLEHGLTDLFGRLPRGEHVLFVQAVDGDDNRGNILIVARDADRMISIELPFDEAPPPLQPTDEAVRRLHEDFGFAPQPGESLGLLVHQAGPMADIDLAAFSATLLDVLMLAYGMPRNDFRFEIFLERNT